MFFDSSIPSLQNSQPTASVLFTEYRLVVGGVVPTLILAIGVLGRKIARGPGWRLADFYVGSELTLAGVTGALVNLFDLLKPDKVFGLQERELTGANILLVVLGILFYQVVLSLKQDVEMPPGKSLTLQLLLLLGFSNFLGLIALVTALILLPQ